MGVVFFNPDYNLSDTTRKFNMRLWPEIITRLYYTQVRGVLPLIFTDDEYQEMSQAWHNR